VSNKLAWHETQTTIYSFSIFLSISLSLTKVRVQIFVRNSKPFFVCNEELLIGCLRIKVNIQCLDFVAKNGPKVVSEILF
jgi:hypothetical protein